MLEVKPIGSNQTEIRTDGARILVSYSTPVAACIDGNYSKTAKKHSATTSKHVSRWCPPILTETKPQEFFDNLLKVAR